MVKKELAGLPFTDLRDLRAALYRPNIRKDISIDEILRYLTELPDVQHTVESVDALVQLARNFQYAARPLETLKATEHAARLALVVHNKLLLCAARGIQGLALKDLGRFADSAVAQIESWSLARDLNDRKREIFAIVNFGTLCVGMGQWNVALNYFGRALEMAEEHGFDEIEFGTRANLADCAVQLRDPASGFRALSQFMADAKEIRFDIGYTASAHNTLASLHLLVDDLDAARVHAEESGRLARIAGVEKSVHYSAAVLGLIEVRSGALHKGLAAIDHALTFARHSSQSDVSHFLGMCIDAHEAAGDPNKALDFLHELVAWKKESIDQQVVPLQCDGLPESIKFQTGSSLFDADLVARTHTLRRDVRERIQRFVEMAINAEIAGCHDLYGTFRVARLARYIAAAVGWDEQRIAPLALGAQLCNIGMLAIPPRILQKTTALSDGERQILRDHTKYGAELLRRSKLNILDVACVISEQHHERYDGTGYPCGLSGEAIAEEARIVAICEAFDRMTHRRPWRGVPLSITEALEEMERAAGSQFDPLLVKTFVDLIQTEFWRPCDFDAFLAEGADEFEYVCARGRIDALIGTLEKRQTAILQAQASLEL